MRETAPNSTLTLHHFPLKPIGIGFKIDSPNMTCCRTRGIGRAGPVAVDALPMNRQTVPDPLFLLPSRRTVSGLILLLPYSRQTVYLTWSLHFLSHQTNCRIYKAYPTLMSFCHAKLGKLKNFVQQGLGYDTNGKRRAAGGVSGADLTAGLI